MEKNLLVEVPLSELIETSMFLKFLRKFQDIIGIRKNPRIKERNL